MTKKLLLLLIASIILLSSCSKKDENIKCEELTITEDKNNYANDLKQYISDNNIQAEYDDRGFYYSIAAQGSSNRPNACSHVTVNYKGSLVNGNTFDQANKVSFSLSSLILGWRIGLPKIQEGGIITLYLPANLGYDEKGVQNSIPPNAITIFTIELLSVS